MKEINYDKTVILFLEELTNILIDTSEKYMWNLILYVKQNIHTAPHKPAPAYFSKFEKKLYFIHCNRNKNTT